MRWVTVFLFAAGSLFGQNPALVRLAHEAERVKTSAESSADDHTVEVAPLHRALREWIESRLPKNKERLAAEFSSLQASMKGELDGAGLSGLDSPPTADADAELPGFGYAQVQFTQMPELSDTLFVTAGASVPCGVDEAIYAYHFDTKGWKLTLEDHPKTAWGWGDVNLELSEQDSRGRRLLLIHRRSVQCASFWMEMTYSIYSEGSPTSVPESLLSGTHGFWLGNDGPEFVLKPDELIMEFLDRSVDVDVHNRTQIHRYSFGAKGVTRLDPIAFQPQDFAQEWLAQPWSEMQSRSAPQTQDPHSKLHGDDLFADYTGVVPCSARPGRWLIALDIKQIGEKELPTPRPTYFLVHELGNYHYEMEAVSDSRPAGCRGQGDASDKHPWLSVDELKALR